MDKIAPGSRETHSADIVGDNPDYAGDLEDALHSGIADLRAAIKHVGETNVAAILNQRGLANVRSL